MLLKLAWVKNLADQSIESVTSLYRCVNSKTAISGLSSDILDCDPLRAYLVFLKFGLVHEQLTCEHCGRPSKFVCRQRTDGAYRIEYHCPGADADKNWNVRPKTSVVSHEWRATSSAVKTAGSKIKGSVSHVKGFRCDDTGFHSNDAESEIARFKLWARQKYAYCRGSSAKSESLKNKHYKHMLAEYCFYVNVGSSFRDVCKALALESA